jgi:hypothetical protein
MKSCLLVCLSVCLLASNVSGQSIQATNQTVVFDSVGRSLGPIVAIDFQRMGLVRMRIGTGESVIIGIAYAFGWQQTALLYPTPDCSGQAYSFDDGLLLPGIRHAMVYDDNRLFLGYPGIDSVYITINSSGTTGGCTGLTPTSQPVYAVAEYMDLDTVFTPPFNLGGGPEEPVTASFSDVPVGHPFYQSVELIKAAGLTAGCGGGQFCPDAAVTRAQMAAFLAQALGLRFLP